MQQSTTTFKIGSEISRTHFYQNQTRLILLWSIWITFAWIMRSANCSCITSNKVISCRYNYMPDEQLESLEGNYDMILSDMQTNLTTERQGKTSGAKIQTLQIQKSTIYNLTPKFFARYSDNSLQSLIMSTVQGSYELDAHTLGGLENSLKTLRINDHELKDLSHLVMLKQLDSLQLVRTKLKALPPNFKDVLSQLRNLDLSENELTTMPWKYLAERIQSYDFHKVQLNKNKWHCDCSLEPILKLTQRAREKIAYFRCHTPVQVQRTTLSELKFAEICPKSLMDKENEDQESVIKPTNQDGIIVPSDSNQQMSSGGGASDERDTIRGPVGPSVATASLSPEVIAVIVAGALLLLIIILAAVIYKVRKRSNERRQQERNRGLAHKTNSYCAVIEHNPPGRPTGGKPQPQQQQQPGSKTNNFGHSTALPPEREPLAHGYHPVNYRDREL